MGPAGKYEVRCFKRPDGSYAPESEGGVLPNKRTVMTTKFPLECRFHCFVGSRPKVVMNGKVVESEGWKGESPLNYTKGRPKLMLFWDIKNSDRRLLSTILDSGTQPYMPGKRATSRVERAIVLLTALKPGRMGAERARLLNKEQRRPFVVRGQSVRDQISCVLHTTN